MFSLRFFLLFLTGRLLGRSGVGRAALFDLGGFNQFFEERAELFFVDADLGGDVVFV